MRSGFVGAVAVESGHVVMAAHPWIGTNGRAMGHCRRHGVSAVDAPEPDTGGVLNRTSTMLQRSLSERTFSDMRTHRSLSTLIGFEQRFDNGREIA